MADKKHRRAIVISLALGTLVLLLLLGALNAFKINFLQPHSAGQIQIFTALTVLVFLLLVVLLVLLLRNILKLMADQRSRALGSRLRSRMLIGAVLISFTPALFMFLFSYWLLNRSIDRWFTQPVSSLRENSGRIALDLANYVSQNARAEAESIARSDSFTANYRSSDLAAMRNEIREHRTTLQGGFTVVYRDGVMVTKYQLPESSQPPMVSTWDDHNGSPAPAAEPLAITVLHAAQRSDGPILTISGTDFAMGARPRSPTADWWSLASPCPPGSAPPPASCAQAQTNTGRFIASGTASAPRIFFCCSCSPD